MKIFQHKIPLLFVIFQYLLICEVQSETVAQLKAQIKSMDACEESLTHRDCRLEILDDQVANNLRKIDSFKKCKFILNIPFIHGACYFIKAEVIKKVGSYDKNFFLYVEDLDWYRRISEKFDTIYFKSIKVTHVHNQSSHKSLRIFIMHLKSILYYYSKWGIIFDKKRKLINKKFFKKLIN